MSGSRFHSLLKSLDIPANIGGELDRFIALFLRWNASINLSAARTEDEVAEHVEDSLQVVPLIREASSTTAASTTAASSTPGSTAASSTTAGSTGTTSMAGSTAASSAPGSTAASSTRGSTPAGLAVIDVGSGGGFPIVVIAICCPEARLVALEPVHKKHAFLKTAIRELRLTNLEAYARRVEDHPDREFDVATSRATFDLRDWLSLGLTLVRPGGRVFGFEGIERTDLLEGTKRYSYALAGKQRAIVSVERFP